MDFHSAALGEYIYLLLRSVVIVYLFMETRYEKHIPNYSLYTYPLIHTSTGYKLLKISLETQIWLIIDITWLYFQH